MEKAGYILGVFKLRFSSRVIHIYIRKQSILGVFKLWFSSRVIYIRKQSILGVIKLDSIGCMIITVNQ